MSFKFASEIIPLLSGRKANVVVVVVVVVVMVSAQERILC